ncbi:ATP-binding protein [Aetokthonos hydrillicola Thurmond2011]|jgi:hypothetical protein|uniref:ATP-binding protein n=1 Tax=Aetokthonos hydrillicola Thurmond2011 TaxID=2712845 RepID=A0AAP5II51_9CYAN|nr:ATP-binding protein [Aetokthonos hydrillicola]MBO3463964.1 ATP-binding protein [Aetokthonos hydrillicola CCALA 1050]MDR9900763.1 ATP-binding protein [Aetokthonos hydrillicola Thurmond2011]
MFKKAVKSQSKLRLALIGVSGSGKTFSALSIASGLSQNIAVIDTEHGSASKYADKFNFDVLELSSFHPQQYINAIQAASSAGYEVLIVDSLSHAWMGKDGALEQVDRIAKRTQSNNSFAAWRDVTPLHNQLVEAIVSSKCHLIATMRAKTEYVLEPNEKGKMAPRKVGMAPIQRDGLEYEFDVVADLDLNHNFIVSKSRCSELSGQIINKPGENVAGILKDWLYSGQLPEQNTTKLEYTIPATYDRNLLNAEIESIIKRRNIPLEQAKTVLFELFNVRSRQQLTDEQLAQFLDYLKSSNAA